MSKSVIIDVESLDNRPTAAILDIAAVIFDIDESKTFQQLISESQNIFYCKFVVEQQVSILGRTIGKETLDWWKRQSEEARTVIRPSEDDVYLDEGLRRFKQFLDGHGFDYKKGLAYSRGTSFDFPMIASACDKIDNTFGMGYSSFPCAFWNQRDVRSALAFAMVKPEMQRLPVVKGSFDGFIKHNAIHDVCKDVVLLQTAVRYAKFGDAELEGKELEII